MGEAGHAASLFLVGSCAASSVRVLTSSRVNVLGQWCVTCSVFGVRRKSFSRVCTCLQLQVQSPGGASHSALLRSVVRDLARVVERADFFGGMNMRGSDV